MSKIKTSIGLGKVKYSSSITTLNFSGDGLDVSSVELILTERQLRKKASGAWPENILKRVAGQEFNFITENRDVNHPAIHEAELNKNFPFLENLKKNKLERFSSLSNPEVKFISHHLAHAHLSRFFQPFQKALVLVFDGAGSRASDFHHEHSEFSFASLVDKNMLEERTLYLLENDELTCLEKKWQKFTKYENHYISSGLGSFYEKISEYIFASNQAAGKVMGLAAFGEATEINDPKEYLRKLDWNDSFKGGSKEEWEVSCREFSYADIAASAQRYFEKNVLNYLLQVKEAYPDIENLILVGGCALNCTTNAKILEQKIFKKVNVPPCPGDGGISFGCALSNVGPSLNFNEENYHAYWGSKSSAPEQFDIPKLFHEYKVVKTKPDDQALLKFFADGEVIAWFQGRSECGPRALGHRSLLASLKKKNLKDYLNKEIKFREDFRPYGCSVIDEAKTLYFDVDESFDNSFMSFAVKSKKERLLSEVTHKDGTSRMQTVSKKQSPIFHQLLIAWGEYSGDPILLNTSLNIMGEPIVETPQDALRFFQNSKVRVMVIGEYLVTK